MGVFISMSHCCINVEVMQFRTFNSSHSLCSHNTVMYAYLFMILRKLYGYRIPQDFQICCLPGTWGISKRKGQHQCSIKSLSHPVKMTLPPLHGPMALIFFFLKSPCHHSIGFPQRTTLTMSCVIFQNYLKHIKVNLYINFTVCFASIAILFALYYVLDLYTCLLSLYDVKMFFFKYVSLK